MENESLIIVDMVEDFVYGKFGSENAQKIISNIQIILAKAREKKIPVIFLKDFHKETDPEVAHWGKHSMRGEKGSEIIPELKPEDKEIIIPKTTYSGFYRTPLESILDNLQIKKVVLVGVATNICVLHNAADSFYRGYKLVIVNDATASFDLKEHEKALAYMEEIYGAEVLSTSDLVKKWEV